MITKKEPMYCPKCNGMLSFLMPSGKYLYCDKCDKYYKNNNGVVGEETSKPENKDNVRY